MTINSSLPEDRSSGSEIEDVEDEEEPSGIGTSAPVGARLLS